MTVSYSPLSAMVASERIKDLRRQAVRRGRIREALRARREGTVPADSGTPRRTNARLYNTPQADPGLRPTTIAPPDSTAMAIPHPQGR